MTRDALRRRGNRAGNVDEAALEFGMPMGPIELADTVGLDICVAVGKMLDPGAAAAEATERARRRGTSRPQDEARLLRLRKRQAGQAIGRSGSGGACRTG
jgi:3-hydroxyacyl-CoA dehydrogenase